MTRKIDVNPNARLVNNDQRPTTDTLILLQEIATKLRALEARIEALESP